MTTRLMISWIALVLEACFQPDPARGQQCTSWCPPPESCVQGRCVSTSGDGGLADTVAPIEGNYVFVTSDVKTPAELGGLDGVDAFCNTLASQAGLPGHYMAWVSSNANPIGARMAATGARGWYRVDGRPFADTLDDVTNAGKTFYPPALTERGANISELPMPWVATGSYAGSDAAGADCNGFSDATGAAASGNPDSGKFGWTSDGPQQQCSLAMRFYCFGIDENQYPVSPQPQANVRRAFITPMGVGITSGGLAAMDSACATAATSAQLTGTYKAWLAMLSASANSRFQTGTPWVRVDDVTTIAGDFSEMTAPLNVTSAGTYEEGRAWSGATVPTLMAQSSIYNCNNWTTTSSSGVIGEVSRGSFYAAFNASGSVVCSNTSRVYCLQQ